MGSRSALRNFEAHCADPACPYDQVVRYRHRDGSTVWIRCRGIAIRDASGTPLRMLGAHNDITEVKRAEEEERQANRAKSTFLANMSHEIRTPLHAVIGLSEELLRTELDEQQRDSLETVLGSAESLLDVINDILDTSRIEAGKLELEETSFDLREIVDGTLRTLALAAEQKGVGLTSAVDPSLPPLLLGDPGRLRQVLTNLVANAVKFTERGEVSVRVGRGEETSGDLVVGFSVCDTGIGIDPRQIERLFRSFEQAEISTAQRYGGSGLGLSICRSLVELMGGAIEVDSAPGEGSTFRFTVSLAVPPADQSVHAHSEPLPETDPVLPALRILLVEDSEANQKVALAMLRDGGHEIAIAEDGRRAVELATTGEFDVALMDIEMPELDGFAATEAIRAAEAESGAHLPIIGLTAHASLGRREQCLASGMDGYLSKPMRREELLGAIARVSNGKP